MVRRYGLQPADWSRDNWRLVMIWPFRKRVKCADVGADIATLVIRIFVHEGPTLAEKIYPEPEPYEGDVHNFLDHYLAFLMCSAHFTVGFYIKDNAMQIAVRMGMVSVLRKAKPSCVARVEDLMLKYDAAIEPGTSLAKSGPALAAYMATTALTDRNAELINEFLEEVIMSYFSLLKVVSEKIENIRLSY